MESLKAKTKKFLLKHKVLLFSLCVLLTIGVLLLSANLPNWSAKDAAGFIAIVISLGSLFNSINWPRIVDLKVVPEDVAQGRGYVDLGDGTIGKRILVYNMGDIRARRVTIKLNPVKAAQLSPEERQLIKQTSVELLSKAELRNPEWSLFSYYLVWNVRHPEEPVWVTGLSITDEKYSEVTGIFMKRMNSSIELYVGDVSSERRNQVGCYPIRRCHEMDRFQ